MIRTCTLLNGIVDKWNLSCLHGTLKSISPKVHIPLCSVSSDIGMNIQCRPKDSNTVVHA